MRPYSLALCTAAASAAAAQQPTRLTADDYARAERALAPSATSLVTGLGARPSWLADGRFWYRATTPNGSAFYMVDPGRRSRDALFDASRLATALTAASGGRFDPNRLPFGGFELSKDNRSISVGVRNRRFNCDLQQYTCSADSTSGGGMNAPQSSSVSP